VPAFMGQDGDALIQGRAVGADEGVPGPGVEIDQPCRPGTARQSERLAPRCRASGPSEIEAIRHQVDEVIILETGAGRGGSGGEGIVEEPLAVELTVAKATRSIRPAQ